MSAGICGKRLGLEDIFGSPSPGPSAKRSRCSSYGSPIRCLDLGFGSDDKLCILFRMFPLIDRKVVESVLDSHDHKIDDAIKNLHALCVGNDCTTHEALSLNAAVLSNDNVIEGGMSTQASNLNAEEIQDENSEKFGMLQNRSSSVDLFVQEMMNASNWDDVRGRTTKFLEGFERSVLAHSTASKGIQQQEIASLKGQLQCLLRDNQILKRGFAIQHERNLEHEEKLKEVPQLKHIISQCQEQARTLQMNNYALKIRLQRAQESSSIPSHFHPDIF